MGLKEDIAKHRKAVYDAKNPEKEIKESKLALLLKERKEQDKDKTDVSDKTEVVKEKETETKIETPAENIETGDADSEKAVVPTSIPLSITEAEFKSLQTLLAERIAKPKDEKNEEMVNQANDPTIQADKPSQEDTTDKLQTDTPEDVLEKTLVEGREKLERLTISEKSRHPIATVIERECENLKVPEANRKLVASAAITGDIEVTSENAIEIIQGVLEKHPNLMRSTSFPAVAGSSSPAIGEPDYKNMTGSERKQVFVEMASKK